MSIKLIAIDIDGTLLNSRKELTAATVEALQAAADHGIHVVISTGRLFSEFADLAAQLPMMRYTVTCTGAQVMDLQTGEDLYRAAFTADELRAIYGRVRDLDGLAQVFSDVTGKIHNDAEKLKRVEYFCGAALAALLQTTHIAEDDLDQMVADYEGFTNKFHMFIPDPAVKAEAIRRLQDLPVDLSESAPNDLEVMPRGIDKGLGLEKLAERLGLTPSEVLAIGDGGNDVGMLRYAGLSAVMANGSDEAKAAGSWLLPWSNDEDGVAKAVWQILKGGKTV